MPQKHAYRLIAIGVVLIAIAWLQQRTFADRPQAEEAYDWKLPSYFPPPAIPDDNNMSAEKVELGRYLFYDPRLSANQTTSCATCHLQALAFSDGQAVSVGATGQTTPRNSMALVNVAYNATYTWANPNLLTLERQIVIPMFGEFPVELGITGNEEEVLERFIADERYQQMFSVSFPEDETPIRFANIVKALAAFTRSLISSNSPYDQYLAGDSEALSESAKRGMELFLSERLECHHCHTGFNLTLSTVHANTTFPDKPFFNTGLYNIDGLGSYPSPNTGVYEITHNPDDMGRFRPPTLRNIALTPPYMHDGSIATLEEVLAFYGAGGRLVEDGPHAGDGRISPLKSGFIIGFELTPQETADLLAFLNSLTDQTFITDPRFGNPFE
jgi:cytochrome c peroxidase